MRRSVWGAALKGIRRQRRGDKVIRYHRATGIRLPDDIPETHPDFIDAWAKCEALAPKLPKGARVPADTIEGICQSLKRSAAWKAVSPGYRQMLARHMDEIRRKYGAVKFTGLRKRHIKADIDNLSPSIANHRLKTWRKLSSHAEDIGLIEEDPCQGVKRPKIKTEGFIPWSHADIEAYRARWKIGTSARACFELVFWTAARTNDAVTLGRQHIGKDGVLTFRQSKTGGLAYVPWTSPLPAYAEAWGEEREQMKAALQCLSGGMTFLETHGQARSIKGLGNLIAQSAREAGLVNRTAHGLRKSRLTMIAECRGTAHSIMAWGGHKTLDEVEEYTRSAAMKLLVVGSGVIQNRAQVIEK